MKFNNPSLELRYNELTKAHKEQSGVLFNADGSRRTGNGIVMMFWRGYDGVRLNWDRASKESLSYASWCAGRDANIIGR